MASSGIDRTYIISLKERYEDRLVPLINHLRELGINSFLVYPGIKNENGALGLIQTIEKLFTESLESELSNILVLEDDVVFLRTDAKERIEKSLSELPQNYDILFLGCNLWQTIIYKYSSSLLQLYDAYALQSCIYSRSGMSKVLRAIKEMKVVIPLDVLIKEKIMTDGNVFCSFPNLTSQVSGFSDIQGKNINYKKHLEDRFLEKTKHLQ